MTVEPSSPRPRDPAAGRALRLREGTQGAHARLDERVMALDPFATRVHYLRLLAVHHRFHAGIAHLYAAPSLRTAFPDLDGRSRLHAIEHDLDDLAVPPPARVAPAPVAADDLPTALGWLYVAEGSTLGAALLLKAAAGLGLDGGFGARHLAAHADGRAQHWRGFTAALDRVPLAEADEARAVDGARAAFDHVRALVEEAHRAG